MNADRLVVVILTLDEEANVGKAVASVEGRAPVVVVDSGSTDRTRELAAEFGAEVHEHPFSDYASQRNHALELVRERFDWVFFLDADEELTPPLWDEISSTVEEGAVDGAYVGYTFRVLGRELRHGGFRRASVLRLMRTARARFVRGTNERVDDSQLRVTRLRNKMIHADAKPLAEWFRKHVRYAEREARHFAGNDDGRGRALSWRTHADRIAVMRRAYNRMPLFVRPFAQFARTVVGGAAWRDGIPGLLFAGMQSLWYPLMIDLFIYEGRQR